MVTDRLKDHKAATQHTPPLRTANGLVGPLGGVQEPIERRSLADSLASALLQTSDERGVRVETSHGDSDRSIRFLSLLANRNKEACAFKQNEMRSMYMRLLQDVR